MDIFKALGVRIMQLTYQYRNLVGDGSGEPGNAGLSRFGHALIRRMNELGIVIDLAHVGGRTTVEAIQASRHPAIVSHSGVRALCDTVRNKTDEEIRVLAAKGGVIGIPPKSGFLRPDGLARGTTIDDYIDHIDYVRRLVGIDHVGIGTDVGDDRKYSKEHLREFHSKFPEVGMIDDSLRTDLIHTRGLDTPAKLPNITAGLVRRGYRDDEIAKVLGGNFLRVFRVVMEGVS